MVNFEKTFQNSASTNLGQKMKVICHSYINESYNNGKKIRFRASYTEWSYNWPYTVIEINILQWCCVLNCFSPCTRVKIPYLEVPKILKNILVSNETQFNSTFINICRLSKYVIQPFFYKAMRYICEEI